MKKLFLISIFILVNYSLWSQIQDNFNFDTNMITSTSIENFTKISFNSCDFTQEVGAPELPYKVVQYVIPYDKKVSSISLDSSRYITLGSYLVYPAQPVYPLDEEPPAFVEPDSSYYNSNSAYPNQLIKIENQYYKNGYHLVTIFIYPLSYIGFTQTLNLYTDIYFTINFEDQDTIPNKAFFQSIKMKELQKNQVLSQIKNTNEIDLMGYGVENVIELDQENENAYYNYYIPEYIIITNNSDINGNILAQYNNKTMTQIFQEFADWKTKKGVPTIVVTVDEIKSKYMGADVQEQIHNYLKDAYSKWGKIFVLFGGDVNVIPARFTLVNFKGLIKYFPTDLYFTAIDNNWNSDGDMFYGECNDYNSINNFDNADLYSDFYYGRAPVENSQEATTFINKILTYEHLYFTNNNYVNNLLAMGGHLSFNYTGPFPDMDNHINLITQSNIQKWKLYDHCV